MTAYVESNFVLEIALGQEQASAAEAILVRAERGEVALAMPAFSLSEPFSTITNRARNQRHINSQLTSHLRELARSAPHSADVQALESVSSLLASIERRELLRLTATVGRVLAVALVVPVTPRIYDEAVTVIERHGFSPQDAIIYATVLDHLRTERLPGPHVFINKNSKDFDSPGVRAELGALDCAFISTFMDGVSQLASPSSD